VLSEVARVYRASRKERDIFWNVYVARPLAAVLVVVLRPTPLTPNQVTFLGLFTFVGAAALLVFVRDWTGFLAAAAVLELSYLLDCADGQLARIKGMTSEVGAYLDFFVDEVKALLLVAAFCLRLFFIEGAPSWLLVGLAGVIVVAVATSLTTFVRRPEYSGEARRPGVPVVEERPTGLLGIPAWAVKRFLRWIAHYPSWFVYLALLDGLEQIDGARWFLLLYLSAHLLYVGRTALAVMVRLGSPAFYRSERT